MKLSEEEKKAIEYFKRQIPKLENIIDWNETFYINPTQSKILRNSLITIINLIEKQQKEINFYKNEELGYIAGYEDGKRHKQTAVMIKKENAQQELFEKEIARLKEIIEKLQKEIEEWRNGTRINDKVTIPKDKIRAKIQIYKDKKADSIGMLINYEYWKTKIEVLQELLEEY